MKPELSTLASIVLFVAWPAVGEATPKTAAPKLAAAVNLENKRAVPLLDFEIVMLAKDKDPEIVLGKLERPLGAGAAASFPLAGGKGCVFEARWTFEDFKASGEVDLCNDGHIFLVD